MTENAPTIHHGWRKFWDLTFSDGWERPYNHPPWLEKILRVSHLKWLRMAYNHPPWYEKILRFCDGWEYPYNHPPWLEKIFRFNENGPLIIHHGSEEKFESCPSQMTENGSIIIHHGWRKFWDLPFSNGPIIVHHGRRKFWDVPFLNGWEWPCNNPPWLEKFF